MTAETLGISSAQSDDWALLLRDVGEGDAAAFDRLYRATRPRLYGLVFKTVRDAGYTEEVLQEVYLEVWQKAHLHSPVMGRPLSWLMMICHRRAVDRVRSEERHKRRTEAFAVLAAGAADAVAADEPVLVREEHREVRRHVAALSALQRQSITLVYFAGLTHTQGAQRLNVPVPTFKSRLRDGLVRLRGLHADSDREDVCA
ncbi:RNA polymerase sigma-70 factor (ECF subfamily) [Williamsia muralis]|uniref:RNA polymerase sigma factor n=1 Tax=Williamsia marianensis TaxID=85044 RepID=A0A495ISP8_WILMA|nr:sigma-70 family RNA polymerase sigma factor [Williamsia muralis]RKR79826.1 RNA polymerase sigma-70 factor (ECF subfamily) [Williamsia muralis]